MSAATAATALPDVGDVTSPDAYAARLYERHHRAIFRLCLNQLRGREDADDAVQMTFVYALTSLRRGVVPQLELPWLFTIARNVCSTRRRSGMRRREYEAPQDLDSIQDRLASPDRPDVATSEDFTTALRAIPESQRRALLLREWKGLSYDEIGSELGLSQAATETLLFRARQNVAQRLGARVGLKTLNGLPLLSLVRNLFQSAAGKAIAVGAAAAVTVVAVPSAQPDAVKRPLPLGVPALAQGHAEPRPAQSHAAPRPAQSHASRLDAHPRTASRSGRPTVHRAPGRPVRDVGAQDPDVASAVAPVSSPTLPSPTATVPAPPKIPSVPSATVGDVVDEVVATASEVTEALTLPAISVPDVPHPIQTPALPTVPSVHVP